MKCLICNEEYSKYNPSFHFKKIHNIEFSEYEINYSLIKKRPPRYCILCNKLLTNHPNNIACNNECYTLYRIQHEIDISREDLNNKLECKICGYRTKSNIASHVWQKHKIIQEDYFKMFNLTIKDCYSQDFLSQLSNNVKGSKNPAYKHGGKFSPYSKKFIKYTNEDEYKIGLSNTISQTKNSKIINCSDNTKISYWMKQGFTEEEAKQKVSERQSTFTKKKCIEKYGKEDGLKVWQARQDKWQETMNSKSEEEKQRILELKIAGLIKGKGKGYSKISQDLFWNIQNRLQLEDDKYSYFWELNKEYKINTESFILLDFVNTKLKKCIEFHGDIFHGNPEIFNENDYPHPFRKNIIAKELWEETNNRKTLIENFGFDYIHVWEADYYKNKEMVIKKCMEFLYNE